MSLPNHLMFKPTTYKWGISYQLQSAVSNSNTPENLLPQQDTNHNTIEGLRALFGKNCEGNGNSNSNRNSNGNSNSNRNSNGNSKRKCEFKRPGNGKGKRSCLGKRPSNLLTNYFPISLQENKEPSTPPSKGKRICHPQDQKTPLMIRKTPSTVKFNSRVPCPNNSPKMRAMPDMSNM